MKFSIDDLAAKRDPEPWDGISSVLSPRFHVLIHCRNPCISWYIRLSYKHYSLSDHDLIFL
jgi:hypothetical protein